MKEADGKMAGNGERGVKKCRSTASDKCDQVKGLSTGKVRDERFVQIFCAGQAVSVAVKFIPLT
jgi:hypothetical protein